MIYYFFNSFKLFKLINFSIKISSYKQTSTNKIRILRIWKNKKGNLKSDCWYRTKVVFGIRNWKPKDVIFHFLYD